MFARSPSVALTSRWPRTTHWSVWDVTSAPVSQRPPNRIGAPTPSIHRDRNVRDESSRSRTTPRRPPCATTMDSPVTTTAALCSSVPRFAAKNSSGGPMTTWPGPPPETETGRSDVSQGLHLSNGLGESRPTRGRYPVGAPTILRCQWLNQPTFFEPSDSPVEGAGPERNPSERFDVLDQCVPVLFAACQAR